ncbi:MAG: hypothetical protein ACOYL8_01340 [Patescibacteria group bacterium]
MSLADIAKNAKEMTDYRLDQKLDEFFRKNPSFKNLGDNREIVFNIIKKYKDKSRHGIKSSRLTVRDDMYHLYEKRLELGLSRTDLDDLKDLLETFIS